MPDPIVAPNLRVIVGIRTTSTEKDEKPKPTTYLGSYLQDGFVYFNDSKFFRCKSDGSFPQVWYPMLDAWVETSLVQKISVMNFNVFAAMSGGGTASNASVENAVQWAINKVSNNYLTYSNSNRNLNNPNGLSYDCSSFVITAFNQAGFNTGNASYTGDMLDPFVAAGFQWIPGNYFTSSQLQRGDIQLSLHGGPGNGHTNIYIGNNQDVDMGSTPGRIITHTPNFFGYGWDGILRYTSVVDVIFGGDTH